MRKVIIVVLTVLIALNIYSQKKVDVISLMEKSNNAYQFVITGNDLNNELTNLYSSFGNPHTECQGEIIWTGIDIAGIGSELQIKLVDGLLTTKNNKSKFKPFKDTSNKNKGKHCKLKCLDENQKRQFYISILNEEQLNVINDNYKTIGLDYIENIIN